MLKMTFEKPDVPEIFKPKIMSEYGGRKKTAEEKFFGTFVVEETPKTLELSVGNMKMEKQMRNFFAIYANAGGSMDVASMFAFAGSKMPFMQDRGGTFVKELADRMKNADNVKAMQKEMEEVLALHAKARASGDYTEFVEKKAVNDMLFKKLALADYVYRLKKYSEECSGYLAKKYGLKYKGYAFCY